MKYIPEWLVSLMQRDDIKSLALDDDTDRETLYKIIKTEYNWAAEEGNCCHRCHTIKMAGASGSAYRATKEGLL